MLRPSKAQPVTLLSVFFAYIFLAVIVVVLVGIYVHHEHRAYLWDYGGYWHMFINAGKIYSWNLKKFIEVVLNSIAIDDYNMSSLVLFMPVYSLFGGGRIAYVSAIGVLYVVPTAFLASRLTWDDDGLPADKRIAFLAAILFPVFWNAAMRGMPDVAGLVPLALAAAMLWNTRFLTCASWGGALTTGVLLWLPFLLRRWYAFSLVALVSVSLVGAMVVIVRVQNRRAQMVLATLTRWVSAGLISITLLMTFQGPLVWRILGTSYSNIYSAYQQPLWMHAFIYFREFGLFTLALAALGVGVDFCRRRYGSAFFLAVAVINGLIFSRVQAPSVQHFLPIALMIFPAYCSGVIFAFRKISLMARWGVPVLLVANIANNFFAIQMEAFNPLRNFFQTSRYPPIRLDNYPEYQRMYRDLGALAPNARIAVFASSPLLTDDLLRELFPPLASRIIVASQVDLRDGFQWNTLSADYVVIGRPTPIHLSREGQRVIVFPAEDIANHTGIGTSFRSMGRTYRLAGGIVAEIYQRTRDIPEADIANLAERFCQAYPEWRPTICTTPPKK